MGEINVSLTPLFNTHTKALYDDLKRKNWTIDVIRVSPGGDDHWSIRQLSVSHAKIFVGVNLTDMSLFAHELLHVQKFEDGHYAYHYWLYMWNAMGTLPSNEYRGELFVWYMNEINNVIMHEIMFADYIAMGFKECDFVYDYAKHCADINDHGYFTLTTGSNIIFKNMCDFVFLVCKINFLTNKTEAASMLDLYNKKYGTVNDALHQPINDLCDRWAKRTVKKNEEFFKELLGIIEKWRANRQFI